VTLLVYLVRHGEVEHHRTDVNLTPRGRAQAEAAGAALAGLLAEGDTVLLYHSPVKRVKETADLMHASIDAALKTSGRDGRVHLRAPRQDGALCNVRFIAAPDAEPEEPSLLYTRINTPAFQQDLPSARADFYRGFWASADPMGYWLTHDSAGGAETVEVVLERLRERLRSLFVSLADDEDASVQTGHTHWIGVTHSGAMRALLRAAFGDDPGEPNFCESIFIEPSDQTGWVTLSYRGRSTSLNLAYR
jgi:broad specificity phosphatase PhoE